MVHDPGLYGHREVAEALRQDQVPHPDPQVFICVCVPGPQFPEEATYNACRFPEVGDQQLPARFEHSKGLGQSSAFDVHRQMVECQRADNPVERLLIELQALTASTLDPGARGVVKLLAGNLQDVHRGIDPAKRDSISQSSMKLSEHLPGPASNVKEALAGSDFNPVNMGPCHQRHTEERIADIVIFGSDTLQDMASGPGRDLRVGAKALSFTHRQQPSTGIRWA